MQSERVFCSVCDTQGRGPTLPGTAVAGRLKPELMIGLLLFALEYTGRDQHLTGKTVALVGAVLLGLGLLAVLAGIGVLSRPNAAASHRRH